MKQVTLKVPDDLFDIAERARAGDKDLVGTYARGRGAFAQDRYQEEHQSDIVRLGRWLMNHLQRPAIERCPWCHRKLTDDQACPNKPCIERIKRLKEEPPERASAPDSGITPSHNPGQTTGGGRRVIKSTRGLA